VIVEAKLLFRRAYIDLMEIKGWKLPDIIMKQETVVTRAAGKAG
jgi:hypothetical protein